MKGEDSPGGRVARDRKVAAQVLHEVKNPCPGCHAARWQRIHELRAQIDQLWTAMRRRTPEYAALVAEFSWLCSVERTFALTMDWPVWQEGQHCRYLEADGRVWWGDVQGFDLEADTVDVHVWNDDDGVFDSSRHVARVITRQQVLDGEHLAAIDDNLHGLEQQVAGPPEPKKNPKRVRAQKPVLDAMPIASVALDETPLLDGLEDL